MRNVHRGTVAGVESTQQVLRQNGLASTVRSIRGGVDVLRRFASRNRRRYLADLTTLSHSASAYVEYRVPPIVPSNSERDLRAVATGVLL